MRRILGVRARWLFIGVSLCAVIVAVATFALSGRDAGASGMGGGCVPDASTHAATCTYHGMSGQAYFSVFSGDGSTCGVVTGGNITAMESVDHTPGSSPSSSPYGVIEIERYDTCTGNWLESGWGSADTVTFHVTGNLDSATMTATGEIYDWVSSSSHTVSVTVSWTGVDTMYTNMDVNHMRSGGWDWTTHLNSDYRNAIATGSYSEDGGSTTSFTAPSMFAALTNSRGSTLQITRA